MKNTEIIILLLGPLSLYLVSVLVKLLQKIWWTPIRIQHVLNSQGVKGPPYRFIHGNTKQILKMRSESMAKPMDLSHDILPRIQPHLSSWISAYGKNCLVWHGSKAQLVITEPELVKEILTDREKAYPKSETQVITKKLLGDGIVTTEGEKWAKLRKLANHAFRAESIKNMVPLMVESVEMMLKRWKDRHGKEMEVSEEFRVLTSDVISRTAFGSSYVEGKAIFEMLRKLAILASVNALKIRFPGLSRFWKSSDEKEAEKLEQGLQDSIISLIRKREKELTEEGNSGIDLLGLLVKAHNEADENIRITVEEVIDECKSFYFAGHETTYSLLSWTVLLLATHTDWQDLARDEVLKLFGLQHPHSEGIARMKTMNMIINESLRLYPPVLTILRQVQREIRLGNIILPANINIIVPTIAIHHDPEIWGTDVHLFKPERFSEGVAKATNNNLAVYLPFGLGPRNCVGMNFALNEAKIALSMILQRYAFTLSPTYAHSPVQVLTSGPQHGIQQIMRWRQRKREALLTGFFMEFNHPQIFFQPPTDLTPGK